jgi:peptide/nickel transport system ATP-binding protein
MSVRSDANDKGGRNSILLIENLYVSYSTRHGKTRVLRDLSLEIERDETYGVVGESGCGKTTLAFAIMKYLGRNGLVDSGKIIFNGEDLLPKSEREMQQIWGKKISMIYQDPTSALNPSVRIGKQISEVLETQNSLSKQEIKRKTVSILEKMQIADPHVIVNSYPHQLSGGMRQRICIGMALITNPDLLIMDEPTTNLDVTTEANILDMISDLRKEFDAAIVYISHNLGVVSKISDRVGIMYGGILVEEGTIEDVICRPQHPYTKSLLKSIPKIGADTLQAKLTPVAGSVLDLKHIPEGCVFQPRCSFSREICSQVEPSLIQTKHGCKVRCHRVSYIPQEEKTANRIAYGNRIRKTEMDTSTAVDKKSLLPILELDGVKKYYATHASWLALNADKRKIKAVDGVSFSLNSGSTLGLVGESGCGKSTLIHTIIGLEDITEGEIEFQRLNINQTLGKRDSTVSNKIQIVFQDPTGTLNPKKTIQQTLFRPIRLTGASHTEALRRTEELLQAVDLGVDFLQRHPDQLSGGQKQRIAIARAFASNPELILCDEPTSSLDVSIQATLVNLLLDLQAKRGTAYLFISHDLSVVSFLSDAMAVMYLGRIVEIGPTYKILNPPYHPYTEALLSSIAIPDPTVKQKRVRLTGSIPSARDVPSGCRFNTRCPRKIGELCEKEEPPVKCVDESGEHKIYCHLPLEELCNMEPVFAPFNDK